MLCPWTRSNYGLVLTPWWIIIKDFGVKRILGKWKSLWRNKWNCERHIFRILRNYWQLLLKENKTVKTEIDIFISLCLKFDMQEIRTSFVHIKSTFRSSCSQMFFRKVVLQNFSIFTRNHLCWSCRTEDLYLHWKETPKLVFFLWLLGNSRKNFL